jgi:DNA polymerase-4
VRRVTALNVSIGVATNKTVAKIASDAGKPDGFVVVAAGGEAAFLAPMPVRALWGVGPRAEEALVAAGIQTIGELAAAGAGVLERVLGSRGPILHEMARGVDDRPVQPVRERKSIGAETTFAHDLPDGPELRETLRQLSDEVAERLREKRTRARTIVLKLRYADFRTITRRTTRSTGTDDAATVLAVSAALLDAIAEPADRFRLLGVTASHLGDASPGDSAQLPLFDEAAANASVPSASRTPRPGSAPPPPGL